MLTFSQFKDRLNTLDLTEEFGIDGISMSIWHDESPLNPRTDWDGHASTLALTHRHYSFSDKHGFDDLESELNQRREKAFHAAYPHSNFSDDETICCPACNVDDDNDEGCEACSEGKIENPFYVDPYTQQLDAIALMLDMALDFSGFVYQPVYLYDHGGIRLSNAPQCRWDSGRIGYQFSTQAHFEALGIKWSEAKAYEYMTSELKTYDNYLNGNVYGFTCEDESCGGYLGEDFNDSGVLEGLHDAYCHELRQKQKTRFTHIKNLIKHRVPLTYRPALLEATA